MTEAPQYGAFDADDSIEPFEMPAEPFEDQGERSEAGPSGGRRAAALTAERLRALEAFSVA